jgi:hypothetical protein
MAVTVRVEQQAASFDDWKKMFDRDPLGRKKSGVRRYSISRSLGEPGYVTIDLEFADSEQAKAFQTALRELWQTPEAQKVMRNPQALIMELVESKEL